MSGGVVNFRWLSFTLSFWSTHEAASTNWAAAEFKDVDLSHQRLSKRALLLAQRLAEKPTASLSGACAGWAETAVAYRFLAQNELDWRHIMAPHWRSSAERMGLAR
ncbi:IS4/Tn5 family transposase DNA-binding protein [Caballeronia choica]|uniref:IS4/Tn5 family transposase DNA-binding protein n=1 Tax=Caballeronia choica TaxID=326476 RepID=UPI000B039673|nr:transposase [Caballeronia choica]